MIERQRSEGETGRGRRESQERGEEERWERWEVLIFDDFTYDFS